MDHPTDSPLEPADIGRRTVLAGAGAAAVALAATACTGTAGRVTAPLSTTVRADGVTVLAATDQVPVGGAVVAGDVVITQPEAGRYEGLSSVCTHQGCAVTAQGADLICPCHQSKFALDGSVQRGPAARPLPPVQIAVDGDDIVLA
ncbi:putative iron-sulfur protein [Gordonia hirsuta DSM 44140 = NBRC 16056]|uniref:Cytochrome bc1 complex Rieske iron-sulfur subunit n=1 Tax=Gordonia hirsuta DSM 44140 = NBRC 16056 TaxID=1121927 RepID=L7L4B8_9ACTN|nr:Rieske (2Fe-2S) protein [Gordonia hirsuta]GAC55965.1 putative iron-sulfur protein [Gordonia hirsuta DSM 44140 = NBRC 16056]